MRDSQTEVLIHKAAALVVVEDDPGRAVADNLAVLQVRIVLHDLDIGLRHHVVHVDFAVLKRHRRHVRIGHDAEGHVLDGRSAAPVILVRGDVDAVAGRPGDELIRAGAAGVANEAVRIGLVVGLREDGHVVGGHALQRRAVFSLESQHHVVVVHNRHIAHGRGRGIRITGVDDGVVREGHILGGHRLAVVELHALAQRQGQLGVVLIPGPIRRQARNVLAVFLDNQRVEQVAGNHVHRDGSREAAAERARLGIQGKDQVGARLGARDCGQAHRQHGGQHEGNQSLYEFHG